jgi:hypothetical protein
MRSPGYSGTLDADAKAVLREAGPAKLASKKDDYKILTELPKESAPNICSR